MRWPLLLATALLLLLGGGFRSGALAAAPAQGTFTTPGLGACDSSVLQASGYLDLPGVGGSEKHYFYWLFAPRRPPVDGSPAPVVMWLSGGPGCSSSMALTVELGPCLMNETAGALEHNAHGWNDEAYLLFVDQPTGVGYSYGARSNYAHNETEVAEDMYHFLQAFARRYRVPDITAGDSNSSPFFITGESYAGHYAPAIAYRVLEGNARGEGLPINLRGVAVGNGITDPYTQLPAYPRLAYEYCAQVLGAPCISQEAYDDLMAQLPTCQEYIRQCNDSPVDGVAACAMAGVFCEDFFSLYAATGRNVYDIRKPCVHGEMCYPMEHSAALFESPVTRTALGVAPEAEEWVSCRHTVGELFTNDIFRNFNYTIPPLLAANISVLLYAGDMDFICNWIGNKEWATQLRWDGGDAFRAAADVAFAVDGHWAGEERRHGSFSFVRIFDAGHMVPMDQPAVALHMLSRFLRNESMRA